MEGKGVSTVGSHTSTPPPALLCAGGWKQALGEVTSTRPSRAARGARAPRARLVEKRGHTWPQDRPRPLPLSVSSTTSKLRGRPGSTPFPHRPGCPGAVPSGNGQEAAPSSSASATWPQHPARALRSLVQGACCHRPALLPGPARDLWGGPCPSAAGKGTQAPPMQPQVGLILRLHVADKTRQKPPRFRPSAQLVLHRRR